MMSRVTVFGGTGFLGRCVVRHLLDAGDTVRIASPHPDRTEGSVERIVADVGMTGEILFRQVVMLDGEH